MGDSWAPPALRCRRHTWLWQWYRRWSSSPETLKVNHECAGGVQGAAGGAGCNAAGANLQCTRFYTLLGCTAQAAYSALLAALNTEQQTLAFKPLNSTPTRTIGLSQYLKSAENRNSICRRLTKRCWQRWTRSCRLRPASPELSIHSCKPCQFAGGVQGAAGGAGCGAAGARIPAAAQAIGGGDGPAALLSLRQHPLLMRGRRLPLRHLAGQPPANILECAAHEARLPDRPGALDCSACRGEPRRP